MQDSPIFSYHDNDVYIVLGGDYNIVSGHFKIDGYSITSGQDPDNHISEGLKVPIDTDGKLCFSIGRKASKEVADWFTNILSPDQTTFNHAPGELNFALIGKLKLTITGGILDKGQVTVFFLDVMLAQGSTPANNNWWFGGQNCVYIGGHTVKCFGKNTQKDQRVHFEFKRGGITAVNRVAVTPVDMFDTANWMSYLSGDTLLNELVMPGSHDAGMGETNDCTRTRASLYFQSQGHNVGEQLEFGSRYFDLRVDYHDDTLVTYHFHEGDGCYGQSLRDILYQTQTFLGEHTTETTILKFSHISKGTGSDPKETKKKIVELLYHFGAFAYMNLDSDVNLANIPLSALAGKMVVVLDFGKGVDPKIGLFRYQDGSKAEPGANLTVYDQFANTQHYDKMKKTELGKWGRHGGLNQDFLFLLSWTLTTKSKKNTVHSLADEANAHLPNVLYGQITDQGESKPNIVYVDYLDRDVAQCIIQYNF